MKRFITVAAKHGEEVLIFMRNAAAGAAGVDAYTWLKNHLQKKQIPHNDQNASHQNQLQHQGGFVSFYIGPDGKWVYVNH
ncbi:hypothetical protein [Mucilaginibacter paludis]|uniref:Uncharacterized protein n=1 Tax=Mucilaginibacter paludis DSM 18603 TaxID=714943 RepID=H1Y3L8_9SPHI|nr:hypothetical protein [Mucilaginibacter paludis]EHQ29786.1 hypothetical protein Mucpa_5717 [Mucilaginibacter paludis DSM 18603]